MRIWDLPPSCLCRSHLLAEHRELHAIWNIITMEKKGYANHPEVNRWRGKLKALYRRHGAVVRELLARAYRHHTPLDKNKATGMGVQATFLQSPAEQAKILQAKGCECSYRF